MEPRPPLATLTQDTQDIESTRDESGEEERPRNGTPWGQIRLLLTA